MALFEFADDILFQKMKSDNPWWTTNKVHEVYLQMNPRGYFTNFYNLVIQKEPHRANVLLGARRIGKTVMLYHTIQQLLKDGVPAQNILYVSADSPVYQDRIIEHLLGIFLKYSTPNLEKRIYFVLDEIQYLPNWEVQLKSIVDSHRSIRMVVSGSAAAALKLKSKESGAGRFTDFNLPAVGFSEYLNMIGEAGIMKQDSRYDRIGSIYWHPTSIEKLNVHFVNYINLGGYPEIYFSETIKLNPKQFIQNDIIDRVLLRDMPALYGIEDSTILNKFFISIAFRTSNEVSTETLSQESGVSKNTVQKYLEYLEAAFLLTKLSRIDQKATLFKKEHQYKLYLTNTALRSACFGPLEPTDDRFGWLVETALFAQRLHVKQQNLHYARWDKGEVDFVNLNALGKPTWAVEVKWSDLVKDTIKKEPIIKFISEHGLNQAWVTTKTISETVQVENVQVNFIPSSVYAYNVSRNAIDKLTFESN